MPSQKLHRLLARQLRKHNISPEYIENNKGFFDAINAAYHSYEYDVAHMEKLERLSSEELFEANQKLKAENIIKSEEAVKARNQLKHVMANVKDILIEVDKNGDFIYLNPPWIAYGEESCEESLGKNFMDFASDIKYFDKEDMHSILTRSFKNDTFRTVFSKQHKSGKLKWWDMSVKILKNEKDIISGGVISLTDVTELKNAERNLIEANQAKGRFLSTMSHEIRTPLNAVIAISNILSIQDPKPSQLENIEVLKYSSKNLLSLINDILDFNKLSSGNLELENAPFNLKLNIENLIKSYSYLVEEKPINLNLEIEKSINQFVTGDSTRLTQVLGNLINNAIKFTMSGSVTLKIELMKEFDGIQTLRFNVIDSGIGIPEDKLESIFDRFTQAEHSTTRKFGGTGLGLAICKKILTLQRSDIYVQSKLGEGTIFWFDLDFEKSEQKDLLEINEEVDKQFDLSGLHLLIVDDNPINVMVATQFFDKWNITYSEAYGSVEAITAFRSGQDFDLILMDLQMPDKNGYETSQNIRALGMKNSFLPIIALSASSSHDVKTKVLAAGMDDYLSKPFDPVDLYNTLKKYYKPKTVGSQTNN